MNQNNDRLLGTGNDFNLINIKKKKNNDSFTYIVDVKNLYCIAKEFALWKNKRVN